MLSLYAIKANESVLTILAPIFPVLLFISSFSLGEVVPIPIRSDESIVKAIASALSSIPVDLNQVSVPTLVISVCAGFTFAVVTALSASLAVVIEPSTI